MNITRTTAALAGIGLALSLSGCSSSTDTAEANAAYCEGAAKVETEVDKMAAPDRERQLGRAGEGPVGCGPGRHRGELGPALPAGGRGAGGRLPRPTTPSLPPSRRSPSDVPPSEAAPQYEAAIDGLTTDIEAVKAEVGCS